MRRLLRFILLLVTSLGIVFILSPAGAVEKPFKPGEKMNYILKYGAIPGGWATLEVLDMEEIDGAKAHHFVMTARSNSFVDIFFKVRDRIDSYTDANMNHSLFYRKDQKEGKTIRKITVDFDWDRNESTYVNFDKEPKIIGLMPGSFDPLSVFYYARLHDFQQIAELERPITDGKKNMMGILRVLGRETIKVPAGTFETLVLEPDLKNVEGVFSKKQKAKIKLWVTADERRLLIKMKSRAKVGSFGAELVSVEGHDSLRVSRLEKNN
ncbi:MAG: DUF3108 domain-containing protein [Desulfobulbales bacterium]|nr:DUF3108 domain-containing protein [Desulfobulbales bacterium]